MATWTLEELKMHRHHNVTIQDYTIGGPVLECLDCNQILLEFHDDKYGVIQLGPHPDDMEN
jgi:hypothetical protein